MSQADISFVEAAAVIGGLGLLAWFLRRHIREHHQDRVRWWMDAVVPWAKRWAVWIFGATLLLWAIVHATAPDEAHDDLNRQIEKLFKPMLEPEGEAEPGAAETE